MPGSATLVPDHPAGGTVHIVLDDFGKLGRSWREMDEEKTGELDIVREIISGEYKRPMKVVAFNIEENWVQDVTENIARAVVEMARKNGDVLARAAAEFVERATGKEVPADVL